MSSRKKRSLGRDPFDEKESRPSRTVERLIRARPAPKGSAKEVEVTVKLTPSNLKQLDRVRAQLAERGRPDITRDDLIRIAITLLSADDIT